MRFCQAGWEALRGDPLPWLLDVGRPNLHWRVLLELVGRPPDSPAVRRARGGANAVGPVAALLADLHPDGTWATPAPPWARYAGVGWRLAAAVAWGADPHDPRLHVAAERLLESAPGRGGFAVGRRAEPSPIVTARAVQALAELGFGGHLRCQEALAWLEESAEVWSGDSRCRIVAAVATTAALAGRPELMRRPLLDRATGALLGTLSRPNEIPNRLGFPNLARTDVVEVLWALARAGVPFEPRLGEPLRRLQRQQGPGGRWHRRVPRPASLPVPVRVRGGIGDQCRWITLRAVVVMQAYAVAAGLPRLFPQPPDRSKGAPHSR